MRIYQPIGKTADGNWTNFDTDYYDDFNRAKEYIRKRALKKECIIYGLDVFDRAKDNYIGMFWRLEDDGTFSRDYKE